MQIVLATHNVNKLTELQQLLAPLKLDVQFASDYSFQAPEESACTFIENALLKARHTSRLSNLPALADDSGLVVPALLGAPGIYSARYSGDNATSDTNIQTLLNTMSSLHNEERRAFFYCVLVVVRHADDPMPLIAEGIWQGSITTEPRGTYGFGYDPIFLLPDFNKTAAELRPEIKNACSHRQRAFKELMHKWSEYL